MTVITRVPLSQMLLHQSSTALFLTLKHMLRYALYQFVISVRALTKDEDYDS